MASDAVVRVGMSVAYAALLVLNWGMWWRNRDWFSWREGVYMTTVAVLLSLLIVSMAAGTLL